MKKIIYRSTVEFNDSMEGDFMPWNEKNGLIHEGYIIRVKKEYCTNITLLLNFSNSIGDYIDCVNENEGYVDIEYSCIAADHLFNITHVYEKVKKIEEHVKKLAKKFEIYEIEVINNIYLNTYAVCE